MCQTPWTEGLVRQNPITNEVRREEPYLIILLQNEGTSTLDLVILHPYCTKPNVSAEQTLKHFLDGLCEEVLAWNQRSHDLFHLLEPEGADERQAAALRQHERFKREEGSRTYVVSPIMFLKL